MINIFPPIKIKVSLIRAIRYAKVTVIVLMIGGFVWMSWFLYDNLYKPLTQAMVVAELKAKVALITVNRKDFEAIVAVIDKRKKLPVIDWAMIPDPTLNVHVPLPAPTSAESIKPPAEPTPPIKALQ